MQSKSAVPPGSTFIYPTMAYVLLLMSHLGWNIHTKFAFGTLARSFWKCWPIRRTRMTLITRKYNSSLQMELVDTKISCLGIGHGSKRYGSLVFYLSLSPLLIRIFAQDIISTEIPDSDGAMFVPILVVSGATTASVATGQTDFWPLYASVGNIHNSIRRGHGNGLVLVGFLAIPKSEQL